MDGTEKTAVEELAIQGERIIYAIRFGSRGMVVIKFCARELKPKFEDALPKPYLVMFMRAARIIHNFYVPTLALARELVLDCIFQERTTYADLAIEKEYIGAGSGQVQFQSQVKNILIRGVRHED